VLAVFVTKPNFANIPYLKTSTISCNFLEMLFFQNEAAAPRMAFALLVFFANIFFMNKKALF
jgi:hypothetical protein